jgi:hypothetical protein
MNYEAAASISITTNGVVFILILPIGCESLRIRHLNIRAQVQQMVVLIEVFLFQLDARELIYDFNYKNIANFHQIMENEGISCTDRRRAISSATGSLKVTNATLRVPDSSLLRSICSISPEKEKNSRISLSLARSDTFFTRTVLVSINLRNKYENMKKDSVFLLF